MDNARLRQELAECHNNIAQLRTAWSLQVATWTRAGKAQSRGGVGARVIGAAQDGDGAAGGAEASQGRRITSAEGAGKNA